MKETPKTELEKVREKFEEFRANREGKQAFPKELWNEAVQLLKIYTVADVSSSLAISPQELRKKASSKEITENPTSIMKTENSFFSVDSRIISPQPSQSQSQSQGYSIEKGKANNGSNEVCQKPNGVLSQHIEQCQLVFEYGTTKCITLSLCSIESSTLESLCIALLGA
jgi:hypothetical protein